MVPVGCCLLLPEDLLSEFLPCLHIRIRLPGTKQFVCPLVLKASTSSIAPLPPWIGIDPAVLAEIQQTFVAFSNWFVRKMHGSSIEIVAIVDVDEC